MKLPCKCHDACDQCLAKGCFYHHIHLRVRDTNLNLATIQQFWPPTLLLQVHHLLLATPAKKEGEGSTGRFSSQWPWHLGRGSIHL